MCGCGARPLAIKAVIPAEAPGRATTVMSSAIAAFTKSCPGSEIDGIPASDTCAKFFPAFKRSINSGIFS